MTTYKRAFAETSIDYFRRMLKGEFEGFDFDFCGVNFRVEVVERLGRTCEDCLDEEVVFDVWIDGEYCSRAYLHEYMLKDYALLESKYIAWKDLMKLEFSDKVPLSEEEIYREKLNEKLETQRDQGIRYNSGKVRLDLIPCALIDGVGRVLTFGAQKYEADNWRKFSSQQVRECIGSAMRHIEAYRKGHWLDEESGLPHLAHAAANLGFILELNKEG